MKKLILDVSKWRCGGEKESLNRLGEGATNLLNHEGYMCCLGQFALQLGATEDNIRNIGVPEETTILIEPLNELLEETDCIEGRYYNTTLSNEAVTINDDENTTPLAKIEKLKELFANHGYEIDVINIP